MTRIGLAIELALSHHKGQVRADGHTPYITHALRVGFSLQKAGASEDAVCAGILHDLIEDTPASWDTLSDALGASVADLVVELSEDKRQPRGERKAQMLSHLDALSPDAKWVKLADRLDNLQEIGRSGWSQEKRARYIVSSRAILSALGGAAPPLAEALAEAITAAEALP